MSTFGSLSNRTFTVVALAKISQYVQLCSLTKGSFLSTQKFKRTTDCPKPGLSIEALMLLSRTLGFEYKLSWAQSFDEIEKSLLNGTADFSLNFLVATEELWTRFSFLPPLNYLELGFACRTPQRPDAEMHIFRPFNEQI